MEWTPENIQLLRKHLGDTQGEFAERMGLERRISVLDWEVGRRKPSGTARKLLDMIAKDAGFTERVAGRLRREMERRE
jgi:DNA-binding transcriptional regulator YiaG